MQCSTLVRLSIGMCGWALVTCFFATPTRAEPCVVRLRYAVSTKDAHTYATAFSSLVEGIADLRLTLYAGRNAYAVQLPRTAIARYAGDQAGPKTWLSEPMYVRFPADAAPLEAAVLEIDDPDSHKAVPCVGNHEVAATHGVGTSPETGTIYPARYAERKADIARAVDAFTAGTPVVAARALPSEPEPACEKPYADASVRRAFQPSYPEFSRLQGHAGQAGAMVELDETGSVRNVDLLQSSGWNDLDAATVDAARRSTYAPEVFRCNAIAGTYLFVAAFRGR